MIYVCNDCDHVFSLLSDDEPEECPDCGSDDIEEERAEE
jgi:DNA-directed RNA polymerase subunit RPC12/RpoP